MCLSIFIPNFRNMRIFTLLALLATLFTSWYVPGATLSWGKPLPLQCICYRAIAPASFLASCVHALRWSLCCFCLLGQATLSWGKPLCLSPLQHALKPACSALAVLMVSSLCCAGT